MESSLLDDFDLDWFRHPFQQIKGQSLQDDGGLYAFGDNIIKMGTNLEQFAG